MKWKVSLSKIDLSRVTVWVEAETSKKAKKKAFEMDIVKNYLRGYDDLYTLTIISEEEDQKINFLKRIKSSQLN